jgi:soluble lytic murein transglycosylase-like protein
MNADQIKRAFGKGGYRNLIAIGIANPTYGDLESKRRQSVPGVEPKWRDDTVYGLIIRYSVQRGIDPFFVMALVKQESNFNTSAKSHKGAMGLMQMMPSTASEVAGVRISPKQLEDPHLNLFLGTRHLRDLVVRYRNPVSVLAAWNAGEGALKLYGTVPPFIETLNFSSNVIDYWQKYRIDNPWKENL